MKSFFSRYREYKIIFLSFQSLVFDSRVWPVDMARLALPIQQAIIQCKGLIEIRQVSHFTGNNETIRLCHWRLCPIFRYHRRYRSTFRLWRPSNIANGHNHSNDAVFESIDDMSINSEQVANTAKLAKLKINADEASEVAERITAILDLVDQMQAVNTEHVEPMANALDAVQRLRIDQANPSEDPQARRAAFQTIAPATDQGLYLVPKVID